MINTVFKSCRFKLPTSQTWNTFETLCTFPLIHHIGMAKQNNPTNDEIYLMDDLHSSKQGASTWGRDIVFAIDVDDPIKIIRTFKEKKHLGADIDHQTSKLSYGGYTWSMWHHKYYGQFNHFIPKLRLTSLCLFRRHCTSHSNKGEENTLCSCFARATC
jgi:hypothetical protein